MLSRRTLARKLEGVTDFTTPSPTLEQYLTPPDIAAHLCHLASLQGDLEGNTVIDLGTGTGMLAIGAAFAATTRVVGIDVDAEALLTARHNERTVAPPHQIEWVTGDVRRHPVSLTDATVLSNPPFGAQHGNKHADRAFLEVAQSLSSVSYTIHNEGSQAFIESFASDNGGTVTHAFRAPFSIPNRFEFHTETETTLETEVFRIEWE